MLARETDLRRLVIRSTEVDFADQPRIYSMAYQSSNLQGTSP